MNYSLLQPVTRNAIPTAIMTNTSPSGLFVVGVVTGSVAGASVGVTTAVVVITGTVVIVVVGKVVRGTLVRNGVATTVGTWVGVPRETATFWLGFAGFCASIENDCAAVAREVWNAIVARPF
jgi:hypothetical protein